MSELSNAVLPKDTAAPGLIGTRPAFASPRLLPPHVADRTIRTYTPPPLGSADWRLCNRLLARRPRVEVRVDGQIASLGLSMPGPVAADLTWLGLGLDGHPGLIGLPASALSLLADGLGVGPMAETELLALLVEASLAPWFDAIEALPGSQRLTLTGDLPGATTDWPHVTAMIRVPGISATLALALCLSPPAATALASALDKMAPPVRPAGLTVLGRVQLARVSIALGSLRHLAPGDLVVLGPDSLSDHLTLCVRSRLAAPAKRTGGTIELTGALSPVPPMEGAGMTTDPATPPVTALPLPSAEISLPVDVDLGTVELRLSDLDGLAAGQVLDLAPQRGDRVTLRSAGRIIAMGELVSLGGTLGVRLTEVAPMTAPEPSET